MYRLSVLCTSVVQSSYCLYHSLYEDPVPLAVFLKYTSEFQVKPLVCLTWAVYILIPGLLNALFMQMFLIRYNWASAPYTHYVFDIEVSLIKCLH